jgi:hypothetical protein
MKLKNSSKVDDKAVSARPDEIKIGLSLYSRHWTRPAFHPKVRYAQPSKIWIRVKKHSGARLTDVRRKHACALQEHPNVLSHPAK